MKFFLFVFSLFVFSIDLIQAQEIEVLEYKTDVTIEELKGLNTRSRECNLSLMPNGRTLYFMSTRSYSKKKGGGDGDIYRAEKKEQGWSPPEFVSQVNTLSGEDEPSVSYDGEKIYFQSWRRDWERTGGPYYEANIVNDRLVNIRGLGGGINQFFRREYNAHMGYATDGMAISPDGNLFIVACGSRYDGNMDLFFSVKQFGEWSFPAVLGVSTRGNERSVYIAADNKTIYFSSDGHGGFGGLDIFKTSLTGFKTGSVVNIGKPFNTEKDDMGFVISGRGEAAYFIRDLDIFYADLNRVNEELKPNSSSLIYGRILLNAKPVQMTVDVMVNNKKIGSAVSDETGKYAIPISTVFSDAVVSIKEDRQGVFEQQKVISKGERYEEFEIDFIADKKEIQNPEKKIEIIEETQLELKESETIVYFSFDKDEIQVSEIEKLKKLVSSIHSNSVIAIEGHTDYFGSSDYNQSLSKRRAISVRDWLMAHAGISKSQVSLMFKGESLPVNSGKSAMERALNRRVTLKIVTY